MNYIDEMFLRADIQQIREFLLHGTELFKIDRRSYKDRLEGPLNILTAKLRERYPEKNEYQQITELVYDCTDAYEEVYLELGLQLGTILAAQVCQSLRAAYERK